MATYDEAVARALVNAEAEPSITKTFWFPAEDELRLLHVDPTTTFSGDIVQPYKFFEADGTPFSVTFIRPEEESVIALPQGWRWDTAQVVYDRAPVAIR